MKKLDIMHCPRLDTVLMVEDTILKLDYYPTKTQLWKELPKKVMYQTYCVIIDYLLHESKIIIHEGEIVWVWNPKLVAKLLSQPELIVRTGKFTKKFD